MTTNSFLYDQNVTNIQDDRKENIVRVSNKMNAKNRISIKDQKTKKFSK